MGVKAALGALLHELKTPGGGQPEEAAALARIARRHYYRYGLLQHRLRARSQPSAPQKSNPPRTG